MAVLRGTVLTPLQPVGAQEAITWGHHGESTRPLAGAMLSDLLGTDARCPACLGASQDCGVCDGAGMSEMTLDLAQWLTKEVLSDLPEEGFELSASAVMAWIDQLRRP